jgi:hypothetical protein
MSDLLFLLRWAMRTKDTVTVYFDSTTHPDWGGPRGWCADIDFCGCWAISRHGSTPLRALRNLSRAIQDPTA